MNKTKRLFCILLVCAVLPLGGCTLGVDAISQLQDAYIVMNVAESVQMSCYEIQYESKLLEFMLYAYSFLGDEYVISATEDILKNISDIKENLAIEGEGQPRAQESLRRVGDGNVSETALAETIEICEGLLDQLEERCNTLIQDRDSVDDQSFTAALSDIDSQLASVRETLRLCFDSSVSYLENYRGNPFLKTIVQDFQTGAQLSDTLYALGEIGLEMNSAYLNDYILIYKDMWNASPDTARLTQENDRNLEQLSGQLDGYISSSGEVLRLAGEIGVALEGYEENLSTLKGQLDQIVQLNQELETYYENINVDNFLKVNETAAGIDKTISDPLWQALEYNLQVSWFFLDYGRK